MVKDSSRTREKKIVRKTCFGAIEIVPNYYQHQKTLKGSFFVFIHISGDLAIYLCLGVIRSN